MRTLILALAMILGISPNVRGAVETDTHTYIVSEKDKAVLAINRQTGEETVIPVGMEPKPMLIHGGLGYVVNYGSNNVSVIDLKSNTVTQTIQVGELPNSMVIDGDRGYVVNFRSRNLSVIHLQSNTVTQSISVGVWPQPMVIHGDRGYIMNERSNNVSVIDLQINSVAQIISVGRSPVSMVFYRGMGYVVNFKSADVSVIDLALNIVTQTIRLCAYPRSIVLHKGLGYVVDCKSSAVTVIDLQTNTEVKTIRLNQIPLSNVFQAIVLHECLTYRTNSESNIVTVIDRASEKEIGTFDYSINRSDDLSDTHLFLNPKKVLPFYPTLASIKAAKSQKTLDDFIKMMPKVFQLGEIEKRKLPNQKNEFDALPPYVLAQGIFWDVDTDKPLMDPKDILSTLITMKYPQKFLKGVAGVWLRKRLHMAFFQAVWVGDEDKAKAMLTYFVQLQDPVITSLATYTFKAPTQGSDQKATNSTDLD